MVNVGGEKGAESEAGKSESSEKMLETLGLSSGTLPRVGNFDLKRVFMGFYTRRLGRIGFQDPG